MSYDDFIIQQEHDHRGWNGKNFECPECGCETETDDYCGLTCFNASLL